MTVFIRLLDSENKAAAILLETSALRRSGAGIRAFSVDTKQLKLIPSSPFAYWVPKAVLDIFKEFPPYLNHSKGRDTRCGLGTLDDFRFLRLFWELGPNCSNWSNYFHGGVFSRFYDSFHLVVNWRDNGSQVKRFVEQKVGSASRKVQGEEKYFDLGFVFPRRTKAFCPKFMPQGGIFSTGGQAGFANIDELPMVIGLLSSSICTYLMSLSQGRTGDAAQFEVGLVKRLPWPALKNSAVDLGKLAVCGWKLKRKLDSVNETSHAFLVPIGLKSQFTVEDQKIINKQLNSINSDINKIAFELYKIDEETQIKVLEQTYIVDNDTDTRELDNEQDTTTDATWTDILSWCVGTVFGRFDWRLATGEREVPSDPEPFDPLPIKSPGMLPDGAQPFHENAGILVDDPSHPHDLGRLIETVLETVDVTVTTDVRRWLQKNFFKEHLQQYSKSRRKAPIYWPLSTASGNYTLWLYYPSLTDQTLYTVVNDFIEPKLKEVANSAQALGSKPNRNGQEETELARLQDLHLELEELRTTILSIAKDYVPNHDDGVQITAAPLADLFLHKPWQKVLKDTWKKLEKGDYDWAHLAMTYWPDRVKEKCKSDKSLAIAHDLEELLDE